ncbi:MAG: SDR family oxidoreductase [Betaproteobacteria bacterium]|nr:SDR family oxidoreductase [Betaproteobacteria bacterium]
MKTVFITGASSGIGKEAALLFAKRGWNVAATMRNAEHLSMFANQKNIKTYSLDVKDNDSVKASIRQAIQDFGKIDVIVNNAGIYTTNTLEQTSDETIHDIIETNIKGVLSTTKAILEHFRENRSGTIINVSSLAGRVTLPFHSIYHASKWAIEGFSESLCYELKPLNIKVKIVEPGMVKTPLYRSALNFPFEQYPDEYQASFKKWHRFLMKYYENGYAPELEAKTIYKAANSNNSKLRYTTDFNTKAIFFLRSLLPLSLFQHIVRVVSG